MFAAILICGLTVYSCKQDPKPTQTVLTGMTATGVTLYDSVTYSYEYDDQYRLVRSKAIRTNSDYVIIDYQFTYSDGHITVKGPANESYHTYECTLDSEGRITHMDETSVPNDSTTIIRHFDYTYDAEGHIKSAFKITENVSNAGVTENYTWEGEEIKSISTTDGSLFVEYETSDAPAQAMFTAIGYDSYFSELCTQGCFGTLPAHMPSKRTMTATLSIPGMPPYVTINNYSYTLNAEGRLATFTDTNDANDRKVSYTFIWEER